MNEKNKPKAKGVCPKCGKYIGSGVFVHTQACKGEPKVEVAARVEPVKSELSVSQPEPATPTPTPKEELTQILKKPKEEAIKILFGDSKEIPIQEANLIPPHPSEIQKPPEQSAEDKAAESLELETLIGGVLDNIFEMVNHHFGENTLDESDKKSLTNALKLLFRKYKFDASSILKYIPEILTAIAIVTIVAKILRANRERNQPRQRPKEQNEQIQSSGSAQERAEQIKREWEERRR